MTGTLTVTDVSAPPRRPAALARGQHAEGGEQRGDGQQRARDEEPSSSST